MKKPSSKFGDTIPELKEIITKYGCGLGDSPPYVVVGTYNSNESGSIMGILAACQNQFHAYLIRREVNKHGSSDVHRTEFHPNPTFIISEYKKGIKNKIDAQKLANEEEKRRAQYPRPRIVAWSGNAQKDNA